MNYLNEQSRNYQSSPSLNYRDGLPPNYQNAPPPNYQNGLPLNYQNTPPSNDLNGLTKNNQNGLSPNYYNNRLQDFRNDPPPNYPNYPRTNYEIDPRTNYQNGPPPNYQNGQPPNYYQDDQLSSYKNGQSHDYQEGQAPNLRQLAYDPHAALFEFTLPPKFAQLLAIGKNETPETFHEPYYKGGQWVFSRVSKATTRDLSLKSIRAHGYQKGAIRPDMGNECDVDCLPVYWKDFGPVCGYKQSFKDHNSKWMKFNNMCELEYQNCRGYTQRWIFVHRGDCPEDAIGKSGYYMDPRERGAPFFRSRARFWLSRTYPTPATRDDDLVTKT